MIFIAWFYYSKFYILGSIMITYLLNKLTTRLYLPPLIINFVSVVMLFVISKDQRTYAMYFNYMPVVTTSAIMNTIIYIIKKKSR